MSNLLKKIINHKKQEVANNMKIISINEMIERAKQASPTRGFYNALKKKVDLKKNAIIAEIKKASPSKGILRNDFNPVAIAKSYQKNGATCLSILTDKKFFQGDNQYLIDVKKQVSIPILRKEFIINPYQVYESRAIGADCILLIASCLNNEQIIELSSLAKSLEMDVIVEVHTLEELENCLKINLPTIGINNRNLNTFEVSLNTTIELVNKIKKDILVITESGIKNADDVKLMRSNNVYSYLVGEAFIKKDNPGQALKEIFL
jgi:indole-3-glycerol phosphate synthase